jgi:hypothetical protein
MTRPMLDWQAWFASKVPEASFSERREPYLRSETYPLLFDEHLGGIAMVTTDLPKHLASAEPDGLMVPHSSDYGAPSTG